MDKEEKLEQTGFVCFLVGSLQKIEKLRNFNIFALKIIQYSIFAKDNLLTDQDNNIQRSHEIGLRTLLTFSITDIHS